MYDNLESKRAAQRFAKKQDKQPRYIGGLLAKAADRKREQDVINMRKMVGGLDVGRGGGAP